MRARAAWTLGLVRTCDLSLCLAACVLSLRSVRLLLGLPATLLLSWNTVAGHRLLGLGVFPHRSWLPVLRVSPCPSAKLWSSLSVEACLQGLVLCDTWTNSFGPTK